MPASVWAMLLLVTAVAILALEMFIPSGGVLGIMAVSSLIASIVVVFKYYGLMWGTLYMIFNAILSPFVIMAALRWWPYTPIGRAMLNLPPGEEGAITSTPSYDKYKGLIGQRGVAQSDMLPSGTVKIGNSRYDAVGKGVAIDAGQIVEVVSVEGNRIIVRPAMPSETSDNGSIRPQEATEGMQQVIPDPFDTDS